MHLMEVKRGIKYLDKNKKERINYSLCEFQSKNLKNSMKNTSKNLKKNKIYNADLNASYNIASRFIYQEMSKIKENLKLKKNEYQQFETKVLELFCRASFCLSDVRKSNKIIKNFVLI